MDALERDVRVFLAESLGIEGIHRPPTEDEVSATISFLKWDRLEYNYVLGLQSVYAPGYPIRDKVGMNVRVGSHVAPAGGSQIPAKLKALLKDVNRYESSVYYSHCDFETIHPFLDGNGRTGRTIWAWHMLHQGLDPFALSFLHQWYYQSLENSGGRV